MNRQKNFLHHTGLLMAIVMAFASGCQKSAPSPEKNDAAIKKETAKVLVGIVREKKMQQVIDLPATIESDETALLMARVEAYVDEVLVDIGDEVEEGQVLIQLEAPELLHQAAEQRAMIRQLLADEKVLQAEAAAARTHLDVVRAKLRLRNSERDRIARLVSTGAIERQRLEEAESSAQSVTATLAKYTNAVQVAEAKLIKSKSEVEVVESRLQAAEAMVGYLSIRAPFAGVVAKRKVDPGNLVRPTNQGSGPLLVIEKIDKLQAIVHATTDVAGQLTVGVPVTFVSDDSPDNPIRAKLSRTAGAYDEKTRMMRAEIDIDNSPDPETNRRPLRSGSYGSALIVLREETLPVVPESALLHRSGETLVVVIRNETCQLTPVEIAIESDGLVGIRSGVTNGDQVVFEKPGAIQPGQTLTRSQMELVP
ncbi:MAG: efflux RND transporter periplasmic adaptor subunit [Planctomycetes bacterium]|nr:efflux RND transporter periplasmic adaptor subunit [Planctomycetota bacterium]